MPITELPVPPSRSDAPQDFSDRADALLGALPLFVTEANALQTEVNANEQSVLNAAISASNSAAQAQDSAAAATTKAGEASASAAAAAASASSAAIAFDSFDDKYLGAKSSDPTTDNDGDALIPGAIYWNTTLSANRVWNGGAWQTAINPSDSSAVAFQQSGTGAVGRAAQEKMRELVSVRDFGAVGDGVTDDAVAIQAAVTRCFSTGDDLYWPDGTYLTTASISNFHAVRHTGSGVHIRSGVTWPITPDRTSLRRLYVSPSGSNTNDGLTPSQPRLTIQGCVDMVHRWGPVVGKQQIIGAAGTYAEQVTLPDGLAQENNYLEFKFPPAPGVRGDPSSWPVGGAVLDGTGLAGTGFEVGRYNKVYVEYLLVRDWYDTGLGATQQVVNGITVDEFSLLYTYGVSAQGNGWNNIYVAPDGSAVVTGGILDGARYGINNTAGRLSLTAGPSTYTTVRNALEYGLYAKHNSSSVLDYTEFVNCGQVAGAEAYGAAVFAYKSGTSIDTRQCTFERNNICYSARGGFISTSIPNTDIYGAGADVNDRLWKVDGFGQTDFINYRSRAAREISLSFGGASTTSTTTAPIMDTNARIPAGYFQHPEQQVEIEIFGNGVTGTGQIRPSFVGNGGAGTRYELENFTLPVNQPFYIRMIVQPAPGGAAVSLWWFASGANIGGTYTGRVDSVAIPFATEEMEFQVWGEVTSGSMAIRKTRVVLWG